MLNGEGSAKELRRNKGKKKATSWGWASIETPACHTLTAHEVRHLGSPLKPEWPLLSAAFLPTFLLRHIMKTEAPTSTESAATAAVGSPSWAVTHTGHHLIVFVCYRNSLQAYQSSLLSWLREPLLTFCPCSGLPPPLSLSPITISWAVRQSQSGGRVGGRRMLLTCCIWCFPAVSPSGVWSPCFKGLWWGAPWPLCHHNRVKCACFKHLPEVVVLSVIKTSTCLGAGKEELKSLRITQLRSPLHSPNLTYW